MAQNVTQIKIINLEPSYPIYVCQLIVDNFTACFANIYIQSIYLLIPQLFPLASLVLAILMKISDLEIAKIQVLFYFRPKTEPDGNPPEAQPNPKS